jgi:membrane-associated protein
MELAFLEGLLDLLDGAWWTYLLLLGICAGDAVFPAFPSETAVIVCGIVAARGDMSLGLVIFFAALGAFLGDNASYALGRWVGQPIVRRLFRGERSRETLAWARRVLTTERGPYILIVARFVPGGRTATTFTSGLVHLRWLTQYAPYILIAAILWATYGALIGYIGGRTFRDEPLYALLLAFAIVALVTLLIEVARRRMRRAT